MTATYDVARPAQGRGARSLRGPVTITARNDSAPGVDRVRLNTVMGPLGGLDLGAGHGRRRARARHRSTTRRSPSALGGVLPTGASVVDRRCRSGRRCARPSAGSTWLFTRANGVVSMYRWVPWISRSTPFDRPNHGDPFVTPVSPA